MTRRNRQTKACSACGGTLSVQPREAAHDRIVTCLFNTVDAEPGLPAGCLLSQSDLPDDSRHAMELIAERSKSFNQKAAERTKCRREILLRYIKEVGEGEPTLDWYRTILSEYTPALAQNVLSTMPYRQNPDLCFDSITVLARIDRRVERLRTNTNEHYTGLVSGFVDSRYELMAFGFDNGLFGSKNPVKLDTVYRHIDLIAKYLEWVFTQGHASLQDAGRMVFDEYVADVDSATGHAYTLSQFYKWAKKKHPFIADVRYHRRGRGTNSSRFETLKLDESRATFERICQYPDPRGRALALLCLLYAQQLSASITLRRDELERDSDTGRWTIARHDSDEAYLVEPEVSEAIDQCLTGDWDGGVRRPDNDTNTYVFIARNPGHMTLGTARKLVREAAWTNAGILRRTGIVNMYRGGQKTMGTVVLRDVLNVSSPTLRKAIYATGESVNTPTTQEQADELRQAFLDDDEDE